MSKTQFVSPAERTDDLTEWERPEDVNLRILELLAAFGLTERDLRLPPDTDISRLVSQYNQPDNKTQKAQAKQHIERLLLIVLNLMLYESGRRNEKDPVVVPVGEWDMRLLVGDDTYNSNFGNRHEVSRIPEDGRHATPISPGEGWWYRMIDYKDNFLKILPGLRFNTAGGGSGPKHQYATDLIQKLLTTK